MTNSDDPSTDVDMLTTEQILDARPDDWRKLGQALHVRFRSGDFVTGLRFVTAVGEAAEAADHHPDAKFSYPFVDLTLISHDAVYRPDDGDPERRVSWVTQRDVELARPISRIAHEHGIPGGAACGDHDRAGVGHRRRRRRRTFLGGSAHR
jgi:4a-hydroxytetrahydrobiopterin dehydratase